MKFFNSFIFIVLVVLAGCASRHGYLDDGRYYQDYDINFDRDHGVFHIPLEDIPVNETTAKPFHAVQR